MQSNYKEGKRQNSLHLKTVNELVHKKLELQTNCNKYPQKLWQISEDAEPSTSTKKQKQRETDHNHKEPINKILQETIF